MYVNYRTMEVDYVNVFLDMYVFVFVCVVALRKLRRWDNCMDLLVFHLVCYYNVWYVKYEICKRITKIKIPSLQNAKNESKNKNHQNEK